MADNVTQHPLNNSTHEIIWDFVPDPLQLSLLPGTSNSTIIGDFDDCATLSTSNVSCAISEHLLDSGAVDDVQTFIPWMNPDNIISMKTLQMIEAIINTRVNLALLVVGVPLNIINCLVLRRQGLKDRMNLCLFSLAVIDMLNILFWFITGSASFLENVTPQVRAWWKWQLRKYVRGLHAFALFSSGCLTMVVAVERCICVTWPMKAAHLMKTRTMLAIILFIVTTLFTLSLVYISHFNVYLVTDPANNRTELQFVPTAFYANYKGFVDFIQTTVLTIVIPFSTFIVVSIATVITVINLRKAISWRKSASGSGGSQKVCRTSSNEGSTKSQTALVKLLVIVSLIYIVTSAPHIVVGIARSIVADFSLHGRYANSFVACHILYLTLGGFNSTVNFFVYITRSSRFRQELINMLPACVARVVHKERS